MPVPSSSHIPRAYLPVRVAVHTGRGSVGSPASVRNSGVGLESLGQIGLLARNELLQFGDLADFFEGANLVLLVTVHR